jgi:predicted TIM-barrel fold metal-dependent hydrolase
MAETNLYICCLADDEIPYLAQYVGEDRLLVGSDYGHIDTNTDLDALRLVSKRKELPPALLEKVLSMNARSCFRIEPTFQPVSLSA